jgi:hypothetical protein
MEPRTARSVPSASVSRCGAADQRLAAGLGLNWRYESDSALLNAYEGYHGVEPLYEDMRQAMHTTIGSITGERLLALSGVTSSCHDAIAPGAAPSPCTPVGTMARRRAPSSSPSPTTGPQPTS